MSRLRRLVRCPRCERQLDASALSAGSRFRCDCGETVEVPPARDHDARVVRCSACGGPRTGDERDCRFCGAGFTIHERDLHTVCPGCFARIGDAARFCHHCGLAILPNGVAGDPGELACPACGADHALRHRPLGEPAVAVAECVRCAGIWLDRAAFEAVVATSRRLPADPEAPPPAPVGGADRIPPPSYRPCPRCGSLMNRRNWGRKSGVIVDVCGDHGTWFDAEELDRIVHWVRRGGLVAAERGEAHEERERVRRDRLTLPTPAPDERWDGERGVSGLDVAEMWLEVARSAWLWLRER